MSKYASLVANCCKIRKIQLRLVTFANFVYTVFVLSAGKITIFEPNVVILPRVIQIYYIFVLRAVNIYYIHKICELHRAVFPSFYNIQQPIFAVLFTLRRSFQFWCWFSLFLLNSPTGIIGYIAASFGLRPQLAAIYPIMSLPSVVMQ